MVLHDRSFSRVSEPKLKPELTIKLPPRRLLRKSSWHNKTREAALGCTLIAAECYRCFLYSTHRNPMAPKGCGRMFCFGKQTMNHRNHQATSILYHLFWLASWSRLTLWWFNLWKSCYARLKHHSMIMAWHVVANGTAWRHWNTIYRPCSTQGDDQCT